MAEVAFSEDSAPYYMVQVSFGGNTFEQLLVSPLVGVDLRVMVDEYADEYERAYTLGLLEVSVETDESAS